LTTIKILKRDVDGLGRKYGALEKRAVVLSMLWCPEKDRKWLAEQWLK